MPNEFAENVKKNNNGKNGNGTGNKEAGNIIIEMNQGDSKPIKSTGNNPFAGIKPGMTQKQIDEQIEKNRKNP